MSKFSPSPRAAPLTKPEEAQALSEASADFGFSRSVSLRSGPSAPLPKGANDHAAEGPDDQSVERPSAPEPERPIAQEAKQATVQAPKGARGRSPKKPEAQVPKGPVAQTASAGTTLKLQVEDDLAHALKLAALSRRVTVRFLILESLAAQGYPVDMDSIPEDGRRVR